MRADWLAGSQRVIERALKKLAADESESVIKEALAMIHSAVEKALASTLVESPVVPDPIKQRIEAHRASFLDLVDWAQKYFPHVVDDPVARRLNDFNATRNLALHGREDPETGELVFEVPRAAYVREAGQVFRQVLRSLSEPVIQPEGTEASPPETELGPGFTGRGPRFPGQQPGEKIIIFRRRHWFVLLTRLIPPVLTVLLATLLAWGIIRLFAPSGWILAVVLLLTYGPPLAWLIWRFLDWENDHYVVTNRRVLHIERVYFLFESRHEAQLERVQDVTVEIPGPIANLLYFGDVMIETAGTEGQIRFELVPMPRKVQSTILKLAPWARSAPTPEGGAQERFTRSGPLTVLWHLFFPQYPRERALYVWRKHWFILLRASLPPFAFLILWFLAWLALGATLRYPMWVDVVFAVGLAGIFLWLLWTLIDWRNDLYVLTPEMVIDIEKMPLIFEHRREASLRMIQDVSYVQPSFLHKLLNYGDLRLETAGTLGEFTFDNVPQPREVQSIIVERLNVVRAEERRRQEQQRREEIAGIVREVLGAGGSP